MREIRRLIIHCSATHPKTDIGVETIRRWHVDDNGWSDIGYHAVIRRDGTLEMGRTIRRIGAHVRGHNRDSIGLCLIGGHGAASTDVFADHFTEPQRVALVPLLKMAHQFGLTIHGHNEYANKGCPGFNVAGFMADNRIKEA